MPTKCGQGRVDGLGLGRGMQRPRKKDKVVFSIFAIRKINISARRIFTQSFFFISVDLESLAQCIESANEILKNANFANFGHQNHNANQCEIWLLAWNVCT